jgi:periplasmic divalent cation tolerance protein
MTRVCLVTCPDVEVGKRLARELLHEKLVACVNVVPGVASLYWWEGQVQEDSEVLLVLKTTEERVDALKERLPQLHPYSVPELLALPVQDGLAPYLRWVAESVG